MNYVITFISLLSPGALTVRPSRLSQLAHRQPRTPLRTQASRSRVRPGPAPGGGQRAASSAGDQLLDLLFVGSPPDRVAAYSSSDDS